MLSEEMSTFSFLLSFKMFSFIKNTQPYQKLTINQYWGNMKVDERPEPRKPEIIFFINKWKVEMEISFSGFQITAMRRWLISKEHKGCGVFDAYYC